MGESGWAERAAGVVGGRMGGDGVGEVGGVGGVGEGRVLRGVRVAGVGEGGETAVEGGWGEALERG